MPPQGDPRSTAWVAQDVLFSTGEALAETKKKLGECEQRCPPEQQLEDALAFLAAREEAGHGASADPALTPRVSLLKRRHPEPGEEPAAGSAVKAPRTDASGAAAAPAGPQAEPASTQQTGVSTQSRRTDSLQSKYIPRAKPITGRGRGFKVGRARK